MNKHVIAIVAVAAALGLAGCTHKDPPAPTDATAAGGGSPPSSADSGPVQQK